MKKYKLTEEEKAVVEKFCMVFLEKLIDEGQKHAAKNIVSYTKQASEFYAKHSSMGRTLRPGVVKIDGAPGGIFNVDGLIRSFWYIGR